MFIELDLNCKKCDNPLIPSLIEDIQIDKSGVYLKVKCRECLEINEFEYKG